MTTKKTRIEIELIEEKITQIKIEGISPLLCSRMPDETLLGVLEGHEKGKSTVRKKRNPEKEYQSSLYPKIDGHYTFPGIAIKQAMRGAAKTFAPNINKNSVDGNVFIPEWIPITGSKPKIDIVQGRDARGTLRVVIRARFEKWSSIFPIEYNANGTLTLDQIYNLLNLAGWSVGIGGYRPEKKGIFGRFRLVLSK